MTPATHTQTMIAKHKILNRSSAVQVVFLLQLFYQS
jgi:hypothetical protein